MFDKLRNVFRVLKESRSWNAILSVHPRGPTWMGHDYQAFAREGYIWNADVYACVNASLRAMRGFDFKVGQVKGTGIKEITSGPLYDLVRHPNPRQSFAALAGEWYGSLELSGNAYLEGVSLDSKNSNTISRPPRELYILRPDRMFIVPGDAICPIAGFEYRAGSVIEPYAAQLWRDPQTNALRPRIPVMHSKYWHPLDDFYGLCYSSDTEILTKHRGWLKFADLSPSDLVATRNTETKAFEWQLPTAYINQPYAGEMLRFQSRSMDILVTPEHRMLAQVQDGSRKISEKIFTAKDLSTKALKSGHYKIPMCSEWNSGVEVPEMVFPWIASNGDWTVRISGDDYCALMGAYIAEGNPRVQGGIEINQKRTSKHFKLYEDLINRINDGSSHSGKQRRLNTKEAGGYNGHAFILARAGLTEHFRAIGKSHEKHIPEIIRNATKRQIEIFWKYYMAGDGHYQKSPGKTQKKNHPALRAESVTNSLVLADHVMEIAQKLGHSASVYERKGGIATIVGVKCHTRKSYKTRFRYASHAAPSSCEKTQYYGTIHCVEVPNGIVYVRRNGKPAWCGNSPIAAASRNIDSSNSAVAWNVNLTQHSARPSGVFTTEQPLTTQEAQAWTTSIRSLFSGPGNAGRPMVLGAGLSWTQLGLTPADMEWLKGLEWNTAKICAIFGLAPEIIGDSGSRTYANVGEARKGAYLEKWLPAADMFCTDLNTWLCPLFSARAGEEFIIYVDREAVEAIQIDRQIKWANAKDGAGFLMVNEQRALLGYDPIPEGDVVMVPVQVVPLSISIKQKPTQLLGQQPPSKDPPQIAPGTPDPGAEATPKPAAGKKSSLDELDSLFAETQEKLDSLKI